MIKIKPIMRKDCQNIIKWNMDRDEDYLIQWSGPNMYSHPLTLEQIMNRLDEENTIIFKILSSNEMIGSVELFNIDRSSRKAKICRFIMNDEYAGKGMGQKALHAVVDYAFYELGLSLLELNVYAYNERAISCYEKVGFLVEKYSENDNPKWNSFLMTLKIIRKYNQQ